MSQRGRVALSGASGFLGSELQRFLTLSGYEIWPMVRRKPSSDREIYYNYHDGSIDRHKLAQCTAVIHLAGKNLMSGLFSKKNRQEIYDSRVKSTRLIAHALADLKDGPGVMLVASAVGIYGDRADQKLDEDSQPGDGFLAKLCVDWERGCLFAKKAGLRVINMRFGVVIDPKGGMLKAICPMFKRGLGTMVGHGDSYITFVTRHQLMQQIMFALEREDMSGPINMVAKEPVTSQEFYQALAGVYQKRLLIKVPSWLIKLLGPSSELFLTSTRAYPRVLIDEGFLFNGHSDITAVLKRLLS